MDITEKQDQDAEKPLPTCMPREGTILADILRDMGFEEYDPSVVNHLLQYFYKYTSTILDDAQKVSSHSRKEIIDEDDIKFAVKMHNSLNIQQMPGSEELQEAARTKNANSLPTPRALNGLHLPPERFCLTGCNYQVAKIPKLSNGTQLRFDMSQSIPQFTISAPNDTKLWSSFQ